MLDITNLLSATETELRKQIKPIRDHYREIYLTSFCLRSKSNLRDLSTLVHHQSLRGACHFTCEQIGILAQTLLYCSEAGDFAMAQLRWHDELCNRLRYLNLDQLESETPRLEILLKQIQTDEGQKLLIGWFKEKPQAQNAKMAWLNDWYLWPMERLLFEIKSNLVESPRVQKEMSNFAEFMQDHRPALSVRGAKHFVMVDEEINAATFLENEDSVRFEKGPLGIGLAATLDFLGIVSAFYHLPFENQIDGLRLKLNAGEFTG